MNDQQISLEDIANASMIERGFIPDFPDDVLRQADEMQPPPAAQAARDMTDKPWVSIDNDDSKDLDQLTYAENESPDSDRIFIAIADVNVLVKKNSPIDLYAKQNTTSVYTPTKVFPMLPPKLSTNLTSLNEEKIRNAIVIEVSVAINGKFTLHDVYPALVRNHAKLAYNSLSDWLDGKGSMPENGKKMPTFSNQIELQDKIARRIKEYRESEGALSFKTIEVSPVLVDGRPIKLEEQDVNRGKQLIENFMIAANVSMTVHMTSKNLPMLRRVVKTPKRWDRIVSLAKEYGTTLPTEPDAKALQQFLIIRRKADPLRFMDLSLAIIKLIGRGEYIVAMPGEESSGHFDLALTMYSHTTAPNRRYPDLIVQRLLKSHFEDMPIPYTKEELTAIAQNCSQKEDAAAKVERRVLKSAAAMVLESQIGHAFPAMVTGINDNGTWVRLFTPPVEGKLVQGNKNVDVGDRINVKLIHVDIPNGFIDFARIEGKGP